MLGAFLLILGCFIVGAAIGALYLEPSKPKRLSKISSRPLTPQELYVNGTINIVELEAELDEQMLGKPNPFKPVKTYAPCGYPHDLSGYCKHCDRLGLYEETFFVEAISGNIVTKYKNSYQTSDHSMGYALDTSKSAFISTMRSVGITNKEIRNIYENM